MANDLLRKKVEYNTRLGAGENKGIKTPQKLEDYVKNAHKEPVNLKRDNSKER